jgi:dihydrofolate reductase
MRKLIVPAFISLDGIIQGPGGPGEDTSGGFSLGGWVVPYADESSEPMGGIFNEPFELVLGRTTYDIFAGYWPKVPADAPHRAFADTFNRTAKHVATHRPESLAWENSHALGKDVVGALRELKRGNGPNLLTQGSSELVRQLLAADVVDELVLLQYPILLGKGKRLYDDGVRPAAFRLASTRKTTTGVMVNRFVREGEVKTGSFALDA